MLMRNLRITILWVALLGLISVEISAQGRLTRAFTRASDSHHIPTGYKSIYKAPSTPPKTTSVSKKSDFINDHATKHAYNPSTVSTPKRTQYGRNIDVKRVREQTLRNPDRKTEHVGKSSPTHPYRTYGVKYEKRYNSNLSTKETPAKTSVVRVNYTHPHRSTQFPKVDKGPKKK